MASNWIIMRKAAVLEDDRAVVRMAEMIGGQGLFASHREEQVDRVIYGWYRVWSVADETEGSLPYSQVEIDHISRCPGFAAAALRVGWLATTDAGTLTVPRFAKHNGASARSRARAAIRQRRRRAKHDLYRRKSVTESVTRHGPGRNGAVTPPPLPLPAQHASLHPLTIEHSSTAPGGDACSNAQGAQDACCAADRRRTLRALRLLQDSAISARAMSGTVRDVVAMEVAGRDVLGFLVDVRERAKKARNPGGYMRAAIREEAASLQGAAR